VTQPSHDELVTAHRKASELAAERPSARVRLTVLAAALAATEAAAQAEPAPVQSATLATPAANEPVWSFRRFGGAMVATFAICAVAITLVARNPGANQGEFETADMSRKANSSIQAAPQTAPQAASETPTQPAQSAPAATQNSAVPVTEPQLAVTAAKPAQAAQTKGATREPAPADKSRSDGASKLAGAKSVQAEKPQVATREAKSEVRAENESAAVPKKDAVSARSSAGQTVTSPPAPAAPAAPAAAPAPALADASPAPAPASIQPSPAAAGRSEAVDESVTRARVQRNAPNAETALPPSGFRAPAPTQSPAAPVLRKPAPAAVNLPPNQAELFAAAAAGDSSQIAAALAAGAVLDARDSAGNTALHTAVLARQVAAVRTLRNAGANRNVLNARGETALQLADRLGFSEMVALLK
jgi:hypothetical protein